MCGESRRDVVHALLVDQRGPNFSAWCKVSLLVRVAMHGRLLQRCGAPAIADPQHHSKLTRALATKRGPGGFEIVHHEVDVARVVVHEPHVGDRIGVPVLGRDFEVGEAVDVQVQRTGKEPRDSWALIGCDLDIDLAGLSC
jgi:hypothetical protein